MRTRIRLYSLAAAAAGIAAALLVYALLLPETMRTGVAGILIALILGIAVAAGAGAIVGKRAVDREIDDLLSVRAMVRTLGDKKGLAYTEPRDYEIAHPVKFIYKELEKIENTTNMLEKEMKRHGRLFASIREGLIISDMSGAIITINPAARRIFSIGETGGDLRVEHCVRDTRLLDEIQSVMAGEKESSEITIHTRGAAYDVRVNRVDLDGSNNGIIIFMRDVTAIIKADRVRRDFVANVSHELKTPLTAIRGFSELMNAGKVPDEAARSRYLDMIILETERLSGLINDILKLSELESIALEEKRTRVELSELARQAGEMLIPAAEKNNVSLKLQAEPCYIFANPERIGELFMNLVDNAIKYNKPGGSVTITTKAENGFSVITVLDTGIGIPEEDTGRVFERFYRVDKSRSRQTGGTGLGLSIVRHIVELYKGEITLQSEIGRGTTITIKFAAA